MEVLDGLDNDCDGLIDEGLDDDEDGVPNVNDACPGTAPGNGVGPNGCTVCAVDPDEDSDGYPASLDCDDRDAAVNPGASETCDGRDDDCDGVVDEGFDADGDGFTICQEPEPDCDDADPSVRPGTIELPGNAVDENCDGSLGDCDPTASWNNHGEFVRCVADEVNRLVGTGSLSQEEGDELVQNASKSSAGTRK